MCPAPALEADAKDLTLRLHWELPVTAGTAELIAQVRDLWTAEEKRSDTPGAEVFSLGPALFESPTGTRSVIQAFTLISPDAGNVWLFLSVNSAPQSEPPPDLQHLDVNKLALALSSTTAIVTYTIRFSIDAETWMTPLLLRAPIEPNSPANTFGSPILEQVGYRYLDGVGGIQEIALKYAQPKYNIEIVAKSLLKVSPALQFPFVREVGDVVLSHLFLPVSSTSRGATNG